MQYPRISGTKFKCRHSGPLGALLVLTACLYASTALAAATDFSGMWIPAADLDTPLKAVDIAFTAQGKDVFAGFNAKRHDSTMFCMPFGTPRNTLNTVSDPLEILQRPEQVTMIFDRMGDVRRIFTDGRTAPEDPIPGWMGYSTGKWENNTLVVNTVALTSESILTEQGIPHSENLQLQERYSLLQKNQEKLLEIAMVLTDPDYYAAPLKVVRYFRPAPSAQMSAGSVTCLLDQWRSRLETINRELFQSKTAPERGVK
jgi:hypothetical protein